MTWSLADIPDQTGRTMLVTGPSVGGLGHHVALELARRGARVVLAGRNDAKLDATSAAITGAAPDARLERLVVDLASLHSVRSAAGRAVDVGTIDVLVNNAGVMAPPLSRTRDGFESQLATNHFGPFLLTGLLLPQLVASGSGRVVVVSSSAHRMARSAPLDDPLTSPRHYRRWSQYGATKLANLLFTYELDRRLRTADLPVEALAAHPGLAGTHLVANGRFGRASGGVASIFDAASKAVSQSAAAGALPVLMAATADLPGGTYCGPAGLGEWRGAPHVTTSSALSHDEVAQRRLWEISEEAVGLRYP
jgi:NAD(P)-dependent dehydrogenase (short-subunit alcohol dehydrogenase family)